MAWGRSRPPNEPYFHAEWEKRALGVTLSCGAFGAWTIDESRHARENLAPATYLSASYYEIWTGAGNAVEAPRLRHPGRARWWPHARKRCGTQAGAEGRHGAGRACQGRPLRPAGRSAPGFVVGERVRTKNFNPTTHTRLPRYARAKVGTIEAVQGSFVFPDDNAHGRGESAQWLYTVVFDGDEIWGEGADPTLTVSIDAWESYLEHV